jgi:hypothetical protein
MPHEVFICYASEDEVAVLAICRALESNGIPCWYSKRDVKTGQDWRRTVQTAIQTSRLFLLVSSAHANASKPVDRELSRTLTYQIPVLVIRIDNEPINPDYDFVIGESQWLEAQQPPLESHFPQLIEAVKTLINEIKEAEENKKRQEETASKAREAEEARKKKEREEAEAAEARREAEAQKTREAALKARQAEEAAKEKKRQQAEAGRIKKEREELEAATQARLEAEIAKAKRHEEEAKKAREATLKAKQEAEAARREKEREEAEAVKAIKAAEEARKARQAAQKAGREAIKAKFGVFRIWLGIILSLVGLGVGWAFPFIFKYELLGFTWPVGQQWTSVIGGALVFSLCGVIPGVLFIISGTANRSIPKPTGRVSNWWWIVPFIFSVFGGFFSWLKHKNTNWLQARSMLIVSLFISLLLLAATIPMLTEKQREVQTGTTQPDVTFSNNSTVITTTASESPTTITSIGYIEGTVCDSFTGLAVSSAQIYIQEQVTTENGKNNGFSTHCYSDDTGYYKADVVSGKKTYIVYVTANSYQTLWYDNVDSDAIATKITLSESGETKKCDFSLIRYGTISGKVVTSINGIGINDAKITLFKYGAGSTTESTKTVYTEADGTYILIDLSPGTYQVRASVSSFLFTNSEQEVYVSVTNTDVTGIDFSFIPIHVYSISGKVTADVGGQPISNLLVYAEEYTTHAWIADTHTGTDGTYTLTNLPAGTYRVRAVPSNDNFPYADEWFNNTYDLKIAQVITIDSSVTGINFSLAGGGSISGRVYTSTGSMTLYYSDVECLSMVDGKWVSWKTTTDGNGKYRLVGLPYGQYTLRAIFKETMYLNNNRPDYVLEYYPEKTRQTEAGLVTVSAGISPANVDFTLDTTGGSISGKVFSETNFKGIAGIHVVVTEYETGEWFGEAFTEADGTYSVHGLPVGRHRVYVDTSWNKSPYIAEYYDNFTEYNNATPVPVDIGQNTPNINFSLTPK